MNVSVMPASHVHDIPAVENQSATAKKASEFSTHTRNVIITLLVMEVLLLGSIGNWLWWGTHQYQNIH